MVKTFLSKFDAIFTLNQDSLLEKYYLDAGIVGGKYALTSPSYSAGLEFELTGVAQSLELA